MYRSTSNSTSFSSCLVDIRSGHPIGYISNNKFASFIHMCAYFGKPLRNEPARRARYLKEGKNKDNENEDEDEKDAKMPRCQESKMISNDELVSLTRLSGALVKIELCFLSLLLCTSNLSSPVFLFNFVESSLSHLSFRFFLSFYLTGKTTKD